MEMSVIGKAQRTLNSYRVYNQVLGYSHPHNKRKMTSHLLVLK